MYKNVLISNPWLSVKWVIRGWKKTATSNFVKNIFLTMYILNKHKCAEIKRFVFQKNMPQCKTHLMAPVQYGSIYTYMAWLWMFIKI